MSMKHLERSICLGGHLNNRYVLGIKYNGHIIYLKEDGIYNVYKVKADEDYPDGNIHSTNGYDIDNDTSYYSMYLSPYFEPGNGKVFKDNLSSYAYQYAGEYKAIMSGRIKAPNSNVLEITSIRRDTVNLKDYCGGIAFINGEYVSRGFTNLKSFEFEAEDFPVAPINAGYMFRGCISLEKVLIGCENPTLVNVEYMFHDCTLLTSVNLNKFKTDNISNMRGMFSNCNSLAELDLSNWNTSNAIDMNGMFYNCSSLTELDLSNFNTSSVENMGHMFQGCTSLESLNLSGWTTKSIKYVGGYQIQYMFSGCTSLAELRLDKCDKDTVSMIINNANLPNNSIPGKQRTIWCDYSVLSEGDLTSPNGWRFEYAD